VELQLLRGTCLFAQYVVAKGGHMKQERGEPKRKKTDEDMERQENTSPQRGNKGQGQKGPQDQTGQQGNRGPTPRPTDFDEDEEERTDQRRRA
jgi:hypothetical protein